MQTTLPKLTLLKLQGESYDLGQCFNARDEHFDCMDQFRSVKGEENHYRCERTLNVWKKSCGSANFRLQMDEREKLLRDRYLFNKAQIKEYTRRKENAPIGENSASVFIAGKV